MNIISNGNILRISIDKLWQPGIILVALLLSIPVLTIAGFVFEPSGENWEHLKQKVLPEYLANSALLVLGVTVGTLLIGVSTAWLTAMCQFPGKKLFVWLHTFAALQAPASSTARTGGPRAARSSPARTRPVSGPRTTARSRAGDARWTLRGAFW